MPTDPVGQSPSVGLEGAVGTDKSTAALPSYSAFKVQFLDFYTIRCGICMDPWGGTGTAQNVRVGSWGFSTKNGSIFSQMEELYRLRTRNYKTIKL